jgi:small subunit ribosomal protein S16
LLRIRLKRIGKKKQPAYRIVVADSRSPRDGRPVQEIGHYNPMTNPPEVVIDGDRALYWVSQGAQPSEAVNRILVRQGLVQGETISS